jgi:hypothetical protein
MGRVMSKSGSHFRPEILVTEQKLASAARLYDRLKGWRTVARLLDELHSAYPSNQDFKSVLLKASVLNQLYNTNVYAIYDMAKHICGVIQTHMDIPDRLLVQRIAEVEFGGKPRRFVSFASKYAHFFIAPERFAIADRYAGWALAVHLGESKTRSGEWIRDYTVFSERIDRLRARDGITASPRELDQYLWLYGCWMDYRVGRLKSKELNELFSQPTPDLQVAFSA